MSQQLTSTTRESLEAVKTKLDAAIQEARAKGQTEREPKAQALFETTAEVLLGLEKAYEDYAKGSEHAWQ